MKLRKNMVTEINRINELKKLLPYLIIFFAIFIVLPMFVGPLFIVYVESDVNQKLKSYESAFMYNYEVIMGADITDAVVMTNYGKLIVGVFAIFKLLFLGLIAATLTTLLQIKILRSGIPPK